MSQKATIEEAIVASVRLGLSKVPRRPESKTTSDYNHSGSGQLVLLLL